jgi:hypothetical protein
VVADKEAVPWGIWQQLLEPMELEVEAEVEAVFLL